jgi:hypothetical protein
MAFHQRTQVGNMNPRSRRLSDKQTEAHLTSPSPRSVPSSITSISVSKYAIVLLHSPSITALGSLPNTNLTSSSPSLLAAYLSSYTSKIALVRPTAPSSYSPILLLRPGPRPRCIQEPRPEIPGLDNADSDPEVCDIVAQEI